MGEMLCFKKWKNKIKKAFREQEEVVILMNRVVSGL